MRISEGNAGWVCVDEVDELPPGALLYVRFQPDGSGRLRPVEVYLDGEGQTITGKHMRELPLHVVEAVVNDDPDQPGGLVRRMDFPGPQLSILASHYATTFGAKTRDNDWTALSMFSQIRDSGLPQPEKVHPKPSGNMREVPPLNAPESGMTDEWLRHLAAAYTAAVRRGEPPAKSLAKQAGVPVRTVHSWVYRARKRGYMAPGKRGAGK